MVREFFLPNWDFSRISSIFHFISRECKYLYRNGQWEEGGVQRPVMSLNEPKKTEARSIRACSAAVQPKPTSINISLEFQMRMARGVSVFAMLGISSYVSIQ